MTDIAIELARPEAFAACFALLPDLAAPDAVLFTARDADGTLAGAGGMLWRGWGRPAGMPAWITVLPDRRRRGIGRRLLAAMAQKAAGEQADLIAVQPVADEGDAASFALACGAVIDGRHFYFEADAPPFLEQTGAIVERLIARKRVPDRARVVPLADAPIDEVKWLVAHVMTTPPPRVAEMLARSRTEPPETAPVDGERSCVLMVSEEVAGVMLSRRLRGGAVQEVVCNVVAPQWRGGWPNALLIDRFTRNTLAQGCGRIAFDCAETVRDTMNLGVRSKADRIAVKTRFRYASAASAEAARRR